MLCTGFTIHSYNSYLTVSLAGCYHCGDECVDDPSMQSGWTGCEEWQGECLVTGNHWNCDGVGSPIEDEPM